MGAVRRWLLLLLVVAAAALSYPAGSARAATSPPPANAAAETSPSLERPLDDCISALPPPGCGHAPEQPGDRGGWMQWTLFGLMVLGLAFIGWRVVRGARRRPSDA